MRIAVDASAIPQQMAGAGVYTFHLIRALAAAAAEHQIIVFARRGLFDEVAASNRNLRVVATRQKSPVMRLAWEQMVLPFLLRRHKIDILHSPHHHTPIFVGPGVRRVVTFNDVTFLLLPERYPPVRRRYMSAVTRAAARVADAIIVPSEAVREDVQAQLGLPLERLMMIPDAAGPQYTPAAEEDLAAVRQKHGLPTQYVLSVGSLEPGKNRRRLIRAFATVRGRRDEPVLAIVGQPAWSHEGDRELVTKLGLESRVRFLGYVPDEDMAPLYTGAALLAFPSLYEGFGLPVLEAMACGTPVVTTNTGATAEVAGDAALLIDPLDESALAAAIEQVLSDDSLRDDLRARGFERVSQYSWERTARETLALYEAIVDRA